MDLGAEVIAAGILISGLACQWLAWRFKLPAIIFLLAAGLLAGPIFHLIDPDALLGDLLLPFVSLAVAIILFEGSLTLKFQDIPGLGPVIRNLTTIGVLITWFLTAFITHWLLAFSWEVSFLFAALMVVTGPTVIIPMIRATRPSEKVASVLLWEGILLDPIGAILAVLAFEFILSGSAAAGFLAGGLIFSEMIGIGLIIGILSGMLFGWLIRRYWIPLFLQNFAALVVVCGVYSLSNYLVHESGLLTVTVMGVWLANREAIKLNEILNFKENLSVILISVLFILLAARVELRAFIPLGWSAFLVFLAIQFVIRPISVHVCAYGSTLTLGERHLLAWIAPRGIVAAAISALFAIRLGDLGYADAMQMVPLTFMVIIGTVVLESATAKTLAKTLDAAEPEPNGFLIVGANSVAQAIAQALVENGYAVSLVDQNWDCVSQAKLKGMDAYWGSPISEQTDQHLPLSGLGHLLAVTPSTELNALVSRHHRMEFGPNHIYHIRNEQPETHKNEDQSVFQYNSRNLFAESVTFQRLSDVLKRGAEIKTTLITDDFNFEDYKAQDEQKPITLFAIDPQKKIHIFTPNFSFAPDSGWKIIGLFPNERNFA